MDRASVAVATIGARPPEAHSSAVTDARAMDVLEAPRWLMPSSVAFLALPTLIFVLGWTRPAVAVPSACAGTAVLWLSLRAAREQRRPERSLDRRATAAIWSTASIVGVLTGAGGLAPQSWDWLKHNAILRDLVVEPWPVLYELDNESFGLTYYIGYYLPAAVVGKAAGWQAANVALLVWTVLGIGLALTWFTVLVGRSPRQMVLLFVGFSGLDIVGRMILGPALWMADPVLPSNQLDWWAVVGKYPSNITSVMWAPHHSLGAWVAAGLIIAAAQSRQLAWVAVPLALTLLISPLVAVGLLPLAIYALVRHGVRWTIGLRSMLSAPAWLSGLFVAPVLIYLFAATSGLPAPYTDTITHGFALTSPIRPLGFARSLGAYGLLITIEVFVFVLLLLRTKVVRDSKDTLMLLGMATGALVLFPLYRYGAWSDLAMRAVVPSIFALAVVVGRAVTLMPRHAVMRRALIGCLLVGLVAPLGEVGRAVTNSHAKGDVVESNFDAVDTGSTSGLVELRDTQYSELPRFWAQYVADADTFFFKEVSRR